MSNEIKSDLNTNETTQNYENSDSNTESQSQSTTTQYEEMGDFILDTRNLDHQEIHISKFKKGIDEYSNIAGKMAVLTAMGIESKTALEFIERDLMREHEIDMGSTKITI